MNINSSIFFPHSNVLACAPPFGDHWSRTQDIKQIIYLVLPIWTDLDRQHGGEWLCLLLLPTLWVLLVCLWIWHLPSWHSSLPRLALSVSWRSLVKAHTQHSRFTSIRTLVDPLSTGMAPPVLSVSLPGFQALLPASRIFYLLPSPAWCTKHARTRLMFYFNRHL